MRKIGILRLVLVLFVFAPKLCSAGWLIIEQQEDRFGNSESQSIFIQDQRIRIETPESVFIIDLQQDLLTLVFPQKMFYWTGHPDTLRMALFDKLAIQVEVMLQHIAENERDSARRTFDRQLLALKSGEQGFMKAIEPTIIQENLTDTILGRLVTPYEILSDSVLLEKVWLSNDLDPYRQIDKEKLRRFTQLFSPPSRVSAFRQSEGFKKLTKNRIVMRSVMPFAYGESKTEVVALRETNIPAEFFAPPADYRPASVEEVLEVTLDDGESPEVRKNSSPFDKPLMPSPGNTPSFPPVKPY